MKRNLRFNEITERSLIFGSTFIKKYFALIKCLIFLIHFNYNNYCYSIVLSFYLEACFANTRYTTLNYKQFFFFLNVQLMRKSNNNTLISRSRQVQSFQWKSSQPTKNSVQKCLCVAIRGNFKSVIVAAILAFLCMLESRFIGSFLSRNQFGNRANDAVALLPSLCLSLVIHAIPCVFISFKGHDRNFRNKEEKEIQFDTFSFSHTLYTSPFTFYSSW